MRNTALTRCIALTRYRPPTRFRWGLGALLLAVTSACGTGVAPAERTPERSAPVPPPAAGGSALVPSVEPTLTPFRSPPPQRTAPPAALTATAVPPAPDETAPAEAAHAELLVRDHLGVQTIDGVQLELARLVIAPKAAFGAALDQLPVFDDVDIVGEITFTITNTTAAEWTVYPEFGFVDINNETVALATYAGAGAVVGDTLSGTIQPNAVKRGGVVFALAQRSVADIRTVQVSVAGPLGLDGRDSDRDYEFDIPVTAP